MLSDIEYTRKALLLENVIIIEGDINEELADYVRQSMFFLMARGSPPITIHISSHGGSLLHGLQIAGYLKNYKGETTGIVADKADSAAIPILQSCVKRIGYPWSHYVLHYATVPMSSDELSDDAAILATKQVMEELVGLARKMLLTRIKKHKEEIQEYYSNQILYAPKALELEIIDEIRYP